MHMAGFSHQSSTFLTKFVFGNILSYRKSRWISAAFYRNLKGMFLDGFIPPRPYDFWQPFLWDCLKKSRKPLTSEDYCSNISVIRKFLGGALLWIVQYMKMAGYSRQFSTFLTKFVFGKFLIFYLKKSLKLSGFFK